MANPKRRHSAERQATRRANWKLKNPNLSICPQCKNPKLPHRVCPTCGYYKASLIVEVEKKKKEEKKKQK